MLMWGTLHRSGRHKGCHTPNTVSAAAELLSLCICIAQLLVAFGIPAHGCQSICILLGFSSLTTPMEPSANWAPAVILAGDQPRAQCNAAVGKHLSRGPTASSTCISYVQCY